MFGTCWWPVLRIAGVEGRDDDRLGVGLGGGGVTEPSSIAEVLLGERKSIVDEDGVMEAGVDFEVCRIFFRGFGTLGTKGSEVTGEIEV